MLTKLNYRKLGLLSLIMLSFSPADLYAADDSGDSKKSMQSTIKQQQELLQQMRELLQHQQGQIDSLKSEVSQLQSKSSSNSFGKNGNSKGEFTTYRSVVRNKPSDVKLYNTSQNQEIVQNITKDGRINTNDNSEILSGDAIDVGSSPMITSRGQISYIGAYSGNNALAISQISNGLIGSTIMSQRQKFDDYAILFGAQIAGNAQLWFASNNMNSLASLPAPSNGQGLYLTNTRLYFLANIGHYISASFDFGTNQTGPFSFGESMITFGNLALHLSLSLLVGMV